MSQSVDLSGLTFMKSGLSVGVKGLQTIDETKGFLPSAVCEGAVVEHLHRQYTAEQGWRQQVTTQLLSREPLLFSVLWTSKKYCFMLKRKKEKGKKSYKHKKTHTFKGKIALFSFFKIKGQASASSSSEVLTLVLLNRIKPVLILPWE